ncbi:hypothetical protein [Aureibacter tunicatorum]|nr:hypothetical protein [Aureibacter tunicatorum]
MAHDFFSDRSPDNVNLTLAKESEFICQKLGLSVHKTKNGLEFLMDNANKEVMVQRLKRFGMSKLIILAYNKDPYFYNYTDIDMNKGLPSMYCSSENASSIDVTDSHKIEIKSSCKLQLKDSPYSVDIVKNGGGEQSWEKTVSEGNTIINLSPYGSGKYEIKDNGQTVDSFFYCESIAGTIKPFLVMEIFIKDLQDQINDILDKSAEPKIYNVNFKSRKSIWRYVIVMKNSNFDDLSIKLEDESVNFEKKEDYFNQQIKFKHMAFESNEQIPFADSSSFQFKLINNEADNSGCLFNALPLPSAKQLTFEQGQAVSEIIVII